MDYLTKVTCRQCQGEGYHETDVDTEFVMDIINTEGKDRKIDCIKRLRNETQLGLKQAKDVVEITMDYMEQLSKVLPQYD